MSELIGWIGWSLVGFCGLVITLAAVCDAIKSFRYLRWLKSKSWLKKTVVENPRAEYR